jgi:hypothetical protein
MNNVSTYKLNIENSYYILRYENSTTYKYRWFEQID